MCKHLNPAISDLKTVISKPLKIVMSSLHILGSSRNFTLLTVAEDCVTIYIARRYDLWLSFFLRFREPS